MFKCGSNYDVDLRSLRIGNCSDGFLGKTHSEETKKKISEAQKKKIPWNKGIKTRPHSEERKRKISESVKRKNLTDPKSVI